MDQPTCRCGHTRDWHNACSKCLCPWFLPRGEKDKTIVAAWNGDKAERMRREGGAS